MTLTIKEIYNNFPSLNSVIKIELKRKISDGVYEDDWNDVNDLLNKTNVILDKAIQSVENKISNDSYSYGAVVVPNYRIALLSTKGEFAEETDTSSVFFGYERHESLIRVSGGYVDHYTDPDNPVDVLEEIFVGFINEKSLGTSVSADNITQFFQVEDLLTYLLQKYSFEDITPTLNILDDFIYEIMNNSEFTDFLTVDTSNITPGYNIQNIRYVDDDAEAVFDNQTSLFDIIQEVSLGHSFFYHREGIFYYQPVVQLGAGIVQEFKDNRIISLTNFRSGIDKVFERIYWKNTLLSYIPVSIKYNTTKEIWVNAVGNETDRNAILTYVGIRSGTAKKECQLIVPFYPSLFIFEEITADLTLGGNDSDALKWGVTKWGQSYWRRKGGAMIISSNIVWTVQGYKHDLINMKTILKLKEN